MSGFCAASDSFAAFELKCCKSKPWLGHTNLKAAVFEAVAILAKSSSLGLKIIGLMEACATTGRSAGMSPVHLLMRLRGYGRLRLRSPVTLLQEPWRAHLLLACHEREAFKHQTRRAALHCRPQLIAGCTPNPKRHLRRPGRTAGQPCLQTGIENGFEPVSTPI